MIYYSFVSTGKWTGYYNSTSGTSGYTINPVDGSICQPSDIVKIEHSTSWNNIETLTFTNNLTSTVTIKNLIYSDWTNQLKDKWFQSYLKHIGLESVITTSNYTSLFQIAEDNNIFYKISYPSIAYVTQNSSSGEISIGMNVYDMDFIMQYAINQPDSNPLKEVIHNSHIANDDLSHRPVYVSAACKVTYQGYTDIVWCFDGLEYNYDLTLLDFEPNIETGGGNIFSEVKLSGDGIRAHYIVRKDIDPEDPTQGLCSGTNGPFCMGDQIHIIDTTVWTKNSSTSGNELVTNGDFSSLSDPVDGFYKMLRFSPFTISTHPNPNDPLGINLAVIRDESNHFVPDVTMQNGKSYDISFDITQLSSGRDVSLWLSNGSTPHTIIQSFNTIGTHTIRINVGSSHPYVSFYTTASDFSSQEAYIDNVSIKEVVYDWTWIGDYSTLPYTWHIADITNPCYDYKYSTVPEMLFPIRVIQDCPFDNFGYHIINIVNSLPITDIIVELDKDPRWLNGAMVTITDMAIIDPSGDYNGNWIIVSRGSEPQAIDGSTDSLYYRLRRTGFDNTQSLTPPVNGQIYLSF